VRDVRLDYSLSNPPSRLRYSHRHAARSAAAASSEPATGRNLSAFARLIYVSTVILTRRFYVRTIYTVEITYDPKKNARNIAKRGLSFDRVHEFGFDTATILEDDRVDYGETRWRAFGLLDGRMHALVYAEIDENVIRVIGLRRANKHEVKLYDR